jgi:prefoldin subunit 5
LSGYRPIEEGFMRYRIPFVVGIGMGVAVGLRYGRPALDRLPRRIRDLRERPDLQEAAGLVSAQAGQLVERARIAVTHRSTAGSTGQVRILNGSSAR